MGNYGKPLNSPNPADRMNAEEQFINYNTQQANKKVLGSSKVSDTTAKRAYAIEQGEGVSQAFKTFPNKTIQPKYHS